jgi:hypothetical protein
VRRPELSARIPKPAQLASQKNVSDFSGGQRRLFTIVFVNLQLLVEYCCLLFGCWMTTAVGSTVEARSIEIEYLSEMM